jgi:hypothetical protein
MILNTPTPLEAPPINSDVVIPRFRDPRYLSVQFPYLLFIPKQYPWHTPLFQPFNHIRRKFPIIMDGDKGFCLHPDVAETWVDLQHCLRALGREMCEIAPGNRYLRRVSPWFFPSRFKFIYTYRTENAARFAVWRSMENFLPLLGYVTMGLWCMQSWEEELRAKGQQPPDWRSTIIEKTKIHPTFLDYVEKSVDWRDERVGALYRIEAPSKVNFEEREQRAILDEILVSILHSNFPIPIYLSWGNLPAEISLINVPSGFHHLVPDDRELKSLNAPQGQIRFSRWAVDQESGEWKPDPFMLSSTFAAATHSGAESSVPTAPFPVLPANSKQKKNETIQAFFIRRKEGNVKRMANETPVDRQRRISRTQNAEKGKVPTKASVFVWEKQDGHYIRQPQIRGEFEDLWTEYAGPERRYDPIHNEWDLCVLFAQNDPVFGQGFAPDPDSDDNDDGAPRIPNIDINMEVVQEPPPRPASEQPPEPDFGELPYDYVPDAEDLGPDPKESDVPHRDLAKASRKCVTSVFFKFGRTPRTEEPEYESVAENLAGTLDKRFGFVLPPSPDRFTLRDPPRESLNSRDLPYVLGMPNIASQLASQKGLEAILCSFFGQCLQARTVNDIDKHLLDFHDPQMRRPASHFAIRREYLKSMRNPAEHAVYYMLYKAGSGLGSAVLMMRRATDLVEVLRQGWGPNIKDVAVHLLARGIPFWLACISAEIMPASVPVKRGVRRKGFKADTTSGLGYRPHKHVFDEHDYHAYTTQRNVRLLHTPRGRIALQYGGAMARLARSEISDDDVFHEFDDDIYDVGDCLWDEKSKYAYWYERLTDHEIDLLCGVYHVGTGK